MANDDAKQRSQARRIGELLTDVKTALAVLAIVAYVVLRVAYGQFYGAFRLTPDDLGLGYLELLAQSALGAAALLIFSGLLISILLAALAGLMAVIAGNSPGRAGIPPRWAIRVAAIALASVLVVLVLVDIIAPATAVSILLVGLASVAAGVARRHLAADEPDPGAVTLQWLRRDIAPLIAVLAIMIGGAILVSDGVTAGTAARAGQSTRSLTLYGVPVVSWRADAATLTWTARDVSPVLRPLAGDCLMYLGQSNGTVFVYHPGPARRGTYRIPAATVLVRTVPDADCVRNKLSPSRP